MSTGFGQIPTIIRKICSAINPPFLSTLINHCLLNVHWKRGQITPILMKNENLLLLDSYRPGSIPSAYAKIFEWTNTIPDFQSVNRIGHSVEHAFLILIPDILLGINSKTPTIKKTCDYIWQYRLNIQVNLSLTKWSAI